MSATLLLADDHRLVLDGLRALISSVPTWQVVGEALDGVQAVRRYAELRPDLAVIDISMPSLNGLEATRRIVAAHPRARVIMLSMHADRHFVMASLKAGARGYVLKDTAFAELRDAIRRVLRGGLFLSASLSEDVLQDLVDKLRVGTSLDDESLTTRQREVLQLYAEGHSTRAIAQTLHVSVKTVDAHRAQIFQKLGLHSIAQLTKFAIREGLTTID